MKDGIRRALSLLLCLSLAIGAVSYRPQRTEAVGLTASAIVVSGIVAVMAACGVTIAAQTESGITDYIIEKLDDYFQTLATVPQSILDWLELESPVDVFTVLTSGQLRFTRPVANKILDFVRWFNQEEGVVSNGLPITNIPTLNGKLPYISNPTASEIQNSGLYCGNWGSEYYYSCSRTEGADIYCCYVKSGDYYNACFVSNLGSNKAYWCTVYTGSASTTSITTNLHDNSTGLYYRLVTGSFQGTYNGELSLYETINDALSYYSQYFDNDTVTITPSQNVSVPIDVTEGATLDITTNAIISDGDTVEDAAQAIFDVVQTDGLTSDATLDSGTGSGDTTVDLSGILDALADILAAIINGPTTIINGIQNLISTPLTNIINGITALPNAIQSALSTYFSMVISRIESLPTAIRATFDTILNDIKNRLTSLPANIASEVRALFVPSAGFMDTYIDSLYQSFASRVGLLTYPLALTESFLMRFLTARYTDPVISWAAVREPFSGQILIQAGSYNFNTMLENQQFERVYDILLVVVKAGMAFALFELCRKKYNSIIYGEGS